MEANDPEQRIAELERQLAEQQGATEPRRFVATSPRMQTWLYVCIYAAWAALAAVFAVMFAVRSAFAIGWVVIGVIAIGLALFGVVGVRRWGWNKRIPIYLTSDALTVKDRTGEAFSFKDAKLGLFTVGQSITLSGTALHLQSGPHRFVLGGRDHRLSTATPLRAPLANTVDGWLPAADFDEVLNMVARRSGLDVRGPAPGEPLRCLLYPSEPMGPRVIGRKPPAPRPPLLLEVGKDAVRVFDPNTNALIASASQAQVTATPANYRQVDDTSTRNVPLLVVSIPDLQTLTIRCRGRWRGQVPKQKTGPDFRVTDADSRALVEEFGLTANLDG
ncbi:hypothetical protein [Mycobacterium sp. E796]|uniref:hypothetical protein n=1 Tax=Mycobacterium sp. E796 TaxID=1834151 RepID=UPI000801C879|nr:hypothetical protein [Mycobacterium sp. E796]OBI42333.1 hypothetical protein A5706_06740 [Mycobacterium sp. E796]